MKASPLYLKLLPPRGAAEAAPADGAPPHAPAAPVRPVPRRRRFPWPRPAAWSRYTLGLVGLLALGLLLRLPVIWAAPLDTPSAPQAAMAAFVRRLALTGGDLQAARPWIGLLPIDLTAGLPLYGWAAALFSGWWGPQPWIGRGLALLGALVATAFLFVVVRRMAGGRAALYAVLFLTLAPPGLYYGRAYLPDTFGWAAATAALAAALRWRDGLLAGRPHAGRWAGVSTASGALAILIAPANLALLPPLLYLAWPRPHLPPPAGPRPDDPARRPPPATLRTVCGLAGLLIGPWLLWQGLLRIGGLTSDLDPAFGGGLSAALGQLGQGAFYGLLAGRLVNGALTFGGVLLLLAGLGRPARPPWPWLFHLWALGGLLVVLGNGARLAADDSILAAPFPALAALAGLGANWLATLPVGIAAALRGHEDEIAALDGDLGDGTPGAAPDPPIWVDGRRPARGAVRRAGWPPGGARRPAPAWPQTRAALLRLGNSGAVLLLLIVFAGGWDTLTRRYQVSGLAARYADAGQRAVSVAGVPAGSRMVVTGPGAAEM
ncbi:MAG TPA: hypothetical protein VKY74_26545, partial [Chloroflexia bacterium]|nr:hypothetical protein [Chloroflexia bacterium]